MSFRHHTVSVAWSPRGQPHHGVIGAKGSCPIEEVSASACEYDTLALFVKNVVEKVIDSSGSNFLSGSCKLGKKRVEETAVDLPQHRLRTMNLPDLEDTGTQSTMSTTVKNSKMARRYGVEFKRQAMELMIHGGKAQRQVARELDVSEYSFNLWKKAYLGQMQPAEIGGEMKSPEEMAKIIRE